ncbi:hypothetical protein O181_002378 [Austropuccinia psidii MF-1]|uniref:Uncharacterized protein n=1 Tax=Austropuccinia psidii MF-1 TaxID=1389203 RepID=A0A9Q3BCD3_9BASI|nr:hypothetical protein [Austropuccinia psidii MF-1]
MPHEYVTQRKNPYQPHLQSLGPYTSWCKEAVWHAHAHALDDFSSYGLSSPTFIMHTLTHELASTPPANHLFQLPLLMLMQRHASTTCLCISAITHPYTSATQPHHLHILPCLGS